MPAKLESVTQDIAVDFSALQRDITRLTEALRELLDAQTQAAGARVSDAADGVKDRLAQATGDARKGAQAASDDIAARIERNPIAAILIALGLGLFIGLIGNRRG
jgi:ElaB/YqjD/DUF883 family membrane-anchored ribosome-binding protein